MKNNQPPTQAEIDAINDTNEVFRELQADDNERAYMVALEVFPVVVAAGMDAAEAASHTWDCVAEFMKYRQMYNDGLILPEQDDDEGIDEGDSNFLAEDERVN